MTDGEVEGDSAAPDDGEPTPDAPPPANEPLLPAVLSLVGMIAAGALAWIALFANESKSADVDPQFMRLIGERTSRFGGTYYQNGLHNKGPFDAWLYHVPRQVLGWDAYWYGISFFIIVGTALIAVAVARVTTVHAVPSSTGLAVGLIAFFHFALGDADYAGVMYSRNETAYMLAAVWIIILLPKCWTPRWSMPSMVAIGVLFGLASQTLLSAAIECVVIAGLVLWIVRDRVAPTRRLRHVLAGTAAALLTFVSAPVWYVLRGSFDEFWAGWWTYAGFQSSATDLTMVDKFQRGWDAMTQYYGNFPLSLMIVVAFVFLTWLFWQRLDGYQRAVHVTAFAWLLAGWLELVLSWRYSSHYFAVVAVPTMFIAALLVAHGLTLVARLRPLRLAPLFPLLALLGCFVYFSDNRVSEGISSIRHYNSPAALTALRQANHDPNTRTVRAILDVVSADDDPLLAWTNSPTPYLEFHRVPASRMFWYTFFQGKIYLGNEGPQYVLPQTWDWFAEDMAEANPPAEWEEKKTPHDPDLPFADYVAEHMSLRYDGSLDNLYVRDDIVDAMTGEKGLDPLEVDAEPAGGDTLQLGEGYCRAVEMTVEGDTTAPMLTFHLGGTPFADRTLALGEGGTSGKDDGEVTDTSALPPATDGVRRVQVVLGDRSAMLVVDGMIAAAVELNATLPTLSVKVDQDGLRIRDVRAGTVDWPANC